MEGKSPEEIYEEMNFKEYTNYFNEFDSLNLSDYDQFISISDSFKEENIDNFINLKKYWTDHF